MSDSETLKARFRGALLGLAVGDATGARYEGMPSGQRRHNCNHFLRYTDDTEMMIALTEVLITCRTPEPEEIARAFLRNLNPSRGYGAGTLKVLSLFSNGMSLSEATRAVFSEGSQGNGAAMRVAPVGLLYHRDLSAVAKMAELSSISTHTHPLAIHGAKLIAISVALVLNGVKRELLAEHLLEYTDDNIYREKITKMQKLLSQEPTYAEVITALGNGVLATESVVTAIYCFIRYGESFNDTIQYCLSLGGDTDTIAAMAGALAGAYLTDRGIPPECINNLEDASRIIDLAEKLSSLALTL